jgi:hypothetical protein
MYEDFIKTISKNNFRGFNSLEYSKGAEGSGQELYVSFRTILRFTAENLNLFTGTSEDSKKQVLKIDWQSDKPMFMFSTSVSCNLKKCYIRNSILGTSIGTLYSPQNPIIAPFEDISYFTEPKLRELRDTFQITLDTTDNVPAIYPSIGNINNIYLNISYLAEILIKESDNEDGKASIRGYLQALCNGVNKALGSINDLQVIIDEDDSVPYVTIVDYQQKRIRGLSGVLSNNKATTTLKGQGLGSMLTNISAQSSITPDVATMISVGAQAQGSVLGEEAVSFSRLSSGLLDKIYPQKFISSLELEEAAKTAADRKKQAATRFQAAMNTYAELVKLQKPASANGPIRLTAGTETDYENVATDFYKYLLAQFTETNQTATALIPIKLSLNMHGIGGIKMYQKFKLSDDVLPLSYNSEYEFIAMGVSHTVDSSKWDTAISATISIVDEEIDPLQAFSVPLQEVELSSDGNVVGATGINVQGSNCPAPGTNIESNGWGGFEKPFERTVLTYQQAKEAIEGATDNKNLQVAVLAVIIQEQGRGGKISGFNHNYGGFDITRGAWKFNTIGASNTNGYVLATEGGTKCKIAYVSFKDAASFFKVKLGSFTRKGFDKPLTGAQVATLWYEKWNGKGARLFWDNNTNNYKQTYATVEEYDKFVVLNFEKQYYAAAKKLIG